MAFFGAQQRLPADLQYTEVFQLNFRKSITENRRRESSDFLTYGITLGSDRGYRSRSFHLYAKYTFFVLRALIRSLYFPALSNFSRTASLRFSFLFSLALLTSTSTILVLQHESPRSFVLASLILSLFAPRACAFFSTDERQPDIILRPTTSFVSLPARPFSFYAKVASSLSLSLSCIPISTRYEPEAHGLISLFRVARST